MRIEAQMEARYLILRLRNGQRRLAYAAVKAINETAKKVQQAQRSRLHREFEVRKRTFMERQIAVIRPFANVKQGRPYAEVAIGDRPRLLLSKFETGGLRLPVKGRRVAVPVTGGPARPTWKQGVVQTFTFRALRLRKAHKKPHLAGRYGRTTRDVKFTRTDSGQYKGQHGTFIIDRERKRYGRDVSGVYQRVGPRRGDIRLVYSFEEPMNIRARLRWVRTARAVAGQWFEELFEREAAKAVAHARGRLA